MRRALHAAFATLLLATLGEPDLAAACACCSEPGQRLELTDDIDTYIRGELEQLRLEATATLYSDAGFPETTLGIVAPSLDPYRVEGGLEGGEFVFDLSDAAGATGRIVLALPARIDRFEVDTRDGEQPPGGNGPALYKEWRLSGTVTLAGIFAAKAATAHARLILHGRGNSCTSAQDFTHWTLAVTGADVAFTLLGKVAWPR